PKMPKMPSTVRYVAKISVIRFKPERTQERRATPAPMRIRAKSALKPRGATSLPKMARNREIKPLAKANAPRSCTIKREKRNEALKATSPTKRERIALAISQPRLFLVIIESSSEAAP